MPTGVRKGQDPATHCLVSGMRSLVTLPPSVPPWRILPGDVTQQRRDRTSVKWTLWGSDVLPCGSRRWTPRPCPAVVEAVSSAMARHRLSGRSGVSRGLSPVCPRTWVGTSLDAARTCSDVMGGIDAILRVARPPGDAVVVSSGLRQPLQTRRCRGRRRIDTPLTPAGPAGPTPCGRLPPQRSREVGRAACLLCNPHNPTGTVPEPGRAGETPRELADRFNVTVVSGRITTPVVRMPVGRVSCHG